MAKTNDITISVSEYKELLLREVPSENDKLVLNKIKDLMLDSIQYEKDYYDKVKLDFKSDSTFTSELVTLFKLIDKDFYITMIKKVIEDKKQKDIEKANIKKMNAVKDAKKED